MNITIHRGTRQIGGCVTEISTEKTRLFIDLGADLIEDKEKSVSEVNIDGLTRGSGDSSVLLITHYHGDHIGRISQALPEIPIYMGEIAKEISLAKAKHLEKFKLVDMKEIEVLKKIKTFKPKDVLKFGDITVTPFLADHSAFDAYSFLIEAGNKTIFYTGDFRLHGVQGKKMLKGLKSIPQIDYLICEGSNISKTEKAQTEFELQREVIKLFKDQSKKYIFILCSSANVDRIFGFYHAYNKTFKKKRPFICDGYQKKIFKAVTDSYKQNASFYNFENSETTPKDGFCILIRSNGKYKEILDRYFTKHLDKSLIIYSMWKGYLDENNEARDESLMEFMKPYSYEYLHTSGHADVNAIKKIAEIIKPEHIVPIHTENPEEFGKYFKNVLLPEDGIPFINNAK